MNFIKLKRIETALFIGIIAALIFGFNTEARELSSKVVRLHVIANSDSDADQALKLMVRNEVLTLVSTITEDCTSSVEAEALISESLDVIEEIARNTVIKNGYDYNVTACLGSEYYDTRNYETFSLPAGEYQSLQVTIGSGEGHNWWCVVFPPICMAATGEELTAEAMAAGLTDDDIAFITTEDEVYVLKFKIVEVFQQIKHRFSSF